MQSWRPGASQKQVPTLILQRSSYVSSGVLHNASDLTFYLWKMGMMPTLSTDWSLSWDATTSMMALLIQSAIISHGFISWIDQVLPETQLLCLFTLKQPAATISRHPQMPNSLPFYWISFFFFLLNFYSLWKFFPLYYKVYCHSNSEISLFQNLSFIFYISAYLYLSRIFFLWIML